MTTDFRRLDRYIGSPALMFSLFVLAAPSSAHAADTIEPFGEGATDLEIYAGMEDVAGSKDGRLLASELVVGYGLLDRVSLCLGTQLQSDAALGGGSAAVYLAAITTPLNTRHVDLDLVLQGTSDSAMSSFEIAPLFELNVDSAPEMDGWGIYLRGSLPLFSRAAPPERDPGSAQASELATRFDWVIGAYLALASRHQILLEVDAAHELDPVPGARAHELGGVSLGYNIVLSDAIELVHELALDVPQQADERAAFAVTLGLITTLEPAP